MSDIRKVRFQKSIVSGWIESHWILSMSLWLCPLLAGAQGNVVETLPSGSGAVGRSPVGQPGLDPQFLNPTGGVPGSLDLGVTLPSPGAQQFHLFQPDISGRISEPTVTRTGVSPRISVTERSPASSRRAMEVLPSNTSPSSTRKAASHVETSGARDPRSATGVRQLDLQVQEIDAARRVEARGAGKGIVDSVMRRWFYGEKTRSSWIGEANTSLPEYTSARPGQWLEESLALAVQSQPVNAPQWYQKIISKLEERPEGEITASAKSEMIAKVLAASRQHGVEAVPLVYREALRAATQAARTRAVQASLALQTWSELMVASGQGGIENLDEVQRQIMTALERALNRPSGARVYDAPKVVVEKMARTSAGGVAIRMGIQPPKPLPAGVVEVPAILPDSLMLPELKSVALGAGVGFELEPMAADILQAPTAASFGTVYRAHREAGESLWDSFRMALRHVGAKTTYAIMAQWRRWLQTILSWFGSAGESGVHVSLPAQMSDILRRQLDNASSAVSVPTTGPTAWSVRIAFATP